MTTTYYRHWRDVPDRLWRWPNFSPAEIACRGTGSLRVHDEALDKLQALRDRLNALAGSPNAWKPWSAPMSFNAGCSKLQLIALAIALLSLSACATGGSDPAGWVAVCPPVVEYDQAFRERAAAELELLPEGSATCAVIRAVRRFSAPPR